MPAMDFSGRSAMPRRSSRALAVVAAALAALAGVACWPRAGPFLWARFGAIPAGAGVASSFRRDAASSEQVALWSRGLGRSRTAVARRAEAADAAAASPARVGVIHVPALAEVDFAGAFEKLNVTNATFFQTVVPDAFQMPLAAKLLAMSNTVDVIVAAHGTLKDGYRQEILRGYQTVSLTVNVPVMPMEVTDNLDAVAGSVVQMAELCQQARGTGVKRSIFFGIGANKSSTNAPAEKKKVYF